MRFWVRELAGWLLVGLGLFLFYVCLGMLFERGPAGDPEPLIIETGPPMIIGIILFRGGIQLLKVAVAARVCMAAQERSAPPPARQRTLSGVQRPARPTATVRPPTGPTP